MVVLSLPAVAAYYKLIIEKETENLSYQSGEVLHVTYRSLYLFLSVCFIVSPGILSIFVLHRNSSSVLLELALTLMAIGFLSVIALTYEWYETNLDEFRDQMEEDKEVIEAKREILDETKQLVDEINFDQMSYWEQLQLKDDFEEIFNRVSGFEYSSDNRLAEIASEYEDFYENRVEELEEADKRIDNLIEDVNPLPTVNDIKNTIQNPKKLSIVFLNIVSFFSIGAIFNILYSFIKHGEITDPSNWYILLFSTALILLSLFVDRRWSDL